MVKALLLSGSLGAGKTTLAWAISEQLNARGAKHAVIDLDGLCQVHPSDDNYDLKFRNLAAVWPNYVDQNIRFALLAGVLRTREDRRRLERAMPGVSALQVGLVRARQPLRESRLRERERSNRDLDWHLAETVRLQTLLDAEQVQDFAVLNEEHPPELVAQQVLNRLGWLDHPPCA